MPQFDFYSWSSLSFWTIFFFQFIYFFLLYYIVASLSELQKTVQKLHTSTVSLNFFLLDCFISNFFKFSPKKTF